jgi:hypothetical protein
MSVLYKELKDRYDAMVYIHNEDGTIRGMSLWFNDITDPAAFKQKFQDYRFWRAKIAGFWYKLKYEDFKRGIDGVAGVCFELVWE